MADVLSPAFVDHYAMNHCERSHQQTYKNHPKSSQGSPPDLEDATNSFFLGSFNCSSSKEDAAKPAQIQERAVNGLKRHIGVPMTSVHAQIKLHSISVHAPKMQPDRFWKDNKEEEVSEASSDRVANARDLTSMRYGEVEHWETFVSSSTSLLQSVPSEVLELVCKRLSPFDLCSLCQVNGYFQKVCSTEVFWSSRIVSTIFDEDLSSKQNVLSAERQKVYVQPVVEPVRLKGDYVIIDPFRILFGSLESARVELARQLHDLQQRNHWVFLVKYRNQTAYFISADNYDLEPAFEISRDGTTLGVHEHPSRFIGVFTKETVDQLLKESGAAKGTTPDGGVSVKGVDGQLICSGDGDFVISGSPHSRRKVSRWIEDDCVRNADVLCAAGGRWTFCDDSSDEEDEDEGDGEITDEEMEMCLDQEDIERSHKQGLDLRWNPQGASFHFQNLSTGTYA